MNNDFSRDDKEIIVRKLVEHFPKCFIEDPKMRLPLKKNIISDLEKEGFPHTHEEMTAGLDWYQSHISYQYALQVGVKRIDLNGKASGTVTAKEHDQALANIVGIKQKLQKRDATQTVAKLHNARRITDDHLRKLDAPTMKAKIPPPAPSSTPAPSPSSKLAKLHEALEAASHALNGPASTLQVAIAGAALGVLIKEAQRVCDEIAEDNGRGHAGLR